MDSGKLYFISDIHLGGHSKAVEHQKVVKLEKFLAYIRKDVQTLFLVGDIFNFWFEYRWVIPRHHFWFLAELRVLRMQGVRMIFIPGNHDMWVQDFFTKQLGIEVYPHGFRLEYLGKRYFIHHGDGLGDYDLGYKRLKAILRHPVSIFGYSLIHPDVGIPFAHHMSKLSEKHGYRETNLAFEQQFIQSADQYFELGYDVVVFGHHHEPIVKEVEDKKLIVLGDWFDHFTFGELDVQGIKLKYIDDV